MARGHVARAFGVAAHYVRLMRRLLALFLLLPNLALAQAIPLDLIVERQARAITLFFALDAADLPRVFGAGADSLVGADGTLDADLLFAGTHPLADALFAPVGATLAGQDAGFDGMAVMLHPPEALPPFATPWDGLTAISICTALDRVDALGLDGLRAYLGYHAFRVDGAAPLTLDLPFVEAHPVALTVREFVEGRQVATRSLTLTGPIVLEGQGRPMTASLALAAMVLLGAAVLGRRRFKA